MSRDGSNLKQGHSSREHHPLILESLNWLATVLPTLSSSHKVEKPGRSNGWSSDHLEQVANTYHHTRLIYARQRRRGGRDDTSVDRKSCIAPVEHMPCGNVYRRALG
jgi:hypothetical protein